VPASPGRQRRAQRVGGDVGQQIGPGGRADLVVDDVQRVALGGQAQHRAREVAAARGVDPAGAQDQVAAAAGADQVLAFELGAAVDAQRPGRRVLVARRVAAAVEDVVGAVVQQPGARASAALRQHAGGGGVERARQVGLALGLVDGGVRGGVDDDLGRHLVDQRRKLSGREKSARQWPGLSKSSATSSPSGASARCSSQPTWPLQPSSRIFIVLRLA
jgi:hypothetical protein